MKGIAAILEAALAGTIIVVIFIYFFPQYQAKNDWSDALLQTTAQDILNIIDLTGKTYSFATNNNAFDQFMKAMFADNAAYVWWKDIEDLQAGKDTKVLYFSKAKKATIIDVVYEGNSFKVYSFTLYIGYVF
jgi:hypothetical protein